MAPHTHDTPYQSPPLAPVDEWEMEEVLVETQVAGNVELPTRRRLEPRVQARTQAPKESSRGLRIDVALAPRRNSPTPVQVQLKEFGGAVVKLEPLPEEAPFHANKVIAKSDRPEPAAPEELQGEGKNWGKKSHAPQLWLWCIGIAIGVLLVAALTINELFLIDRKKSSARPLELAAEAKVDEVKGFEIGGSSEETARNLAAAYAKAKTPEEVYPIIRHAARLAARLKLDWQPWNAPPNWQPTNEHAWEVSVKGGICHGVLRGQKPDFSRYGLYFVCEGETLQIDWEATQGLGDTDFATLNRGLGSGGVIRAYLTPENFYSLVFPEAEYAAYKMLAPDRSLVIWGYVKLGTPAETALQKVFEAEKHADAPLLEQAVTLRLTPPPKGAQKNQWLIGEMLHIDWVSP
ncbi:MAG: hypothetical protein WCP45_16685 [Verrucomicrobiota bacterium]